MTSPSRQSSSSARRAPRKRIAPTQSSTRPCEATEPCVGDTRPLGEDAIATEPPARGAAPTTRPLDDKILGGDFQLLHRIAEGGMGWIYEAKQRSTGKRRAVKVLEPSLRSDEAMNDRLLDEARLGSRVESDHAVEVICAGRDAELGAYLVMELLHGRTLAETITDDGPLPLADAAAVLCQLGHALELTHEEGIVHHDLTPNNVFLGVPRRSDVAWTVKLLDFGIAALIGPAPLAARGSKRVFGTPGFMAPEQADPACPISMTSDVWSLGLLAFYVLTGKHFWFDTPGRPLPALVVKMQGAPIAAASARAAAAGSTVALPPWFDGWFAQCVHLDAEARFPDAGIAIGAFQDFAGTSRVRR
jgi:eukaryotic-like serine/threonine-protein kinase